MTTPTRWWHAQNDAWLTAAPDDPDLAEMLETGEVVPFSNQVLALLDEVEEVFTRIGADTPGWEDPHQLPDGTLRDSRDEEYSRCLDAGKYRILWTRAEAWSRVLTGLGWAEETLHEDPSDAPWLIPPPAAPHRTAVLHPHRPGAQPLVLARTRGADEDRIAGLIVGLGDPAVPSELFPFCGCDACDSGSRDVLEALDTEILSLVDGSLEIALAPGWYSKRTSFGAEGGSGPDRPALTATVTAMPWAEAWTPRPMDPSIAPEGPADGRGR